MPTMDKHRIIPLILAFSLTVVSIGPSFTVNSYAAEKTLTLKQACNLCVANSMSIEKIESKINAKKAAKASAIKSIAAKKKNMSTIRWSPLLSFKWPTKPDMLESYEFQFKPIQIQFEIDKLTHQLTDQKLAEYDKVNNTFVNIVTAQEQISFTQKRIESMEKTLSINRAKLLIGDANAKDIKSMESKINSLKNKLVEYTRALDTNKQKLSDMIDVDVTSGYKFQDPYVESDVPRSELPKIIQHTLDNDQNYYEACMSALEAKMSLQTDAELIRNRYGSKANSVMNYVNNALAGNKVNSRGFKSNYDNFLQVIDAPWQGDYTIRLLFFKISFAKERLKGDLDGIRYIEDDPYAMYTAALEYQDARLEKEKTEKELRATVEESFNTYISMKNAYKSFIKQVEDAKAQLEKDEVANRLGILTYEEFASSQDSFEELQMDKLQALADYSKNLYDFDRLTCGAVSEFLQGTGNSSVVIGGGVSNLVEETAEGATYNINYIAQQEAFDLSINIPDDISVKVTDFELWINGIQVGNRTPATESLRHLGLSVDNADSAKIRLYNGNTFVCDCDIDPSNYSGTLKIITNLKVVGNEAKDLGTYSVDQNTNLGTMTLTFKIDEKEGIGFFKLQTKDDELPLGDGELIPIDKEFKHLISTADSLDELEIIFYDKSKGKKYKAYFDTNNSKVKKLDE